MGNGFLQQQQEQQEAEIIIDSPQDEFGWFYKNTQSFFRTCNWRKTDPTFRSRRCIS